MSKPTNPIRRQSPPVKPSGTIIIQRKAGDAFTIVPKAVSEDPRLSWRAKGILEYLIGKPDGWKTRVADIRKHGKEGEKAIWRCLRELRATGYAQLDRVKDERGRFIESIWKVADSPVFEPEKAPHGRLRHVDSRHLSKKERSKNESKPAGKQKRKPRSPAQQRQSRRWMAERIDPHELDPQLPHASAPAISGIIPDAA